MGERTTVTKQIIPNKTPKENTRLLGILVTLARKLTKFAKILSIG